MWSQRRDLLPASDVPGRLSARAHNRVITRPNAPPDILLISEGCRPWSASLAPDFSRLAELSPQHTHLAGFYPNSCPFGTSHWKHFRSLKVPKLAVDFKRSNWRAVTSALAGEAPSLIDICCINSQNLEA